MKKTLFAIGAMVAMVACSNDFVVKEAAQEVISFENVFVDNATRSVVDPSLNAGNLANFHVYGYVNEAPLFDAGNTGVVVTKSGNDWTYDGTKYWIADAAYNFSAVAPATNGNWSKTAADKDATTLSFTNNGTTDLLYAQTAQITGLASRNPDVAFTFRHTLSKVKFSFKNGYDATNTTIRVKDIKIIDAYKTGVVVLDADTDWTPGTNDLTLNFGNAALTEADNSATVDQNDKGLAFGYNTTIESYKELFMIPGAGATVNPKDNTKTNCYTIKFTVELLTSGQEIKQYEHTIYTEFAPEPGKSYDLLAEITYKNIDPDTVQEPIVFTVTEITDWDNDHDGKENTPAGDTDGDNQVDTELK